jgi:vacuolar-type H+-ATPase subunit F/Vma7
MNPVEVIGDPETVLAFALGSIPGRVAQTAAEAQAAVEAALQASRRAGGPVRAPALLLITRRSAALIRAYLAQIILDARGPLILEIPGFGENSQANDVAMVSRHGADVGRS